MKLYFDCLGVYIKNEGLTTALNDMLVEVLKRSTYAEEGQMVYLNTFTKEQVCKATGKSMERMKQAIRIWVKNKILVRVARGVYQVNPYIVRARHERKGDWKIPNMICQLYLTIMRGTPTMVQLLIIYYVVFASATWHTNFVSRQYITNTEDRDFSLPCYSQSDLLSISSFRSGADEIVT